jgi:parallel beta-helix repeat protein
MYYTKNYDSIVADNTMTKSGGIWLGVSQAASGERADYSYFAHVTGNTLSGYSHPDHGKGPTLSIGPGADGGLSTKADPVLPSVGVVGNVYKYNTLKGPGKDVTGETSYNKSYSDFSGIMASNENGVAGQASSVGVIIEGNEVSDCHAGAHTASSSYYTVVRNNKFTNNGADVAKHGEPTALSVINDSFKIPAPQALPTDHGTAESASITLVIDSNEAVVNGEVKYLDVPAKQIDDRTLTPARFVAENLGAQVSWDEDTKTVTITR